MKKLSTTLFLFAVSILYGHAQQLMPAPQDLVVGENFTNPLGMNLENPSFSWVLPVLGSNQSAYRIVVAGAPEKLLENPDVWDSGKVGSSQSVKVRFPKEIASRQKLYWSVKYWDESGRESEWGNAAWFEAGLKNNSDWAGVWISAELDKSAALAKPVYLRKDFNSAKEISHARLYATAKGIYQLYLNGKKVDRDFWSPGWTDYRKRIQTIAYDVTDLIKDGENTFASLLGNGWYCGKLGFARQSKLYGSKPEFLAQLEIFYKDGTSQIIKTDESWKYSHGPTFFADIYDGEDYDASLEEANWNAAGFDASKWKQAETAKIDAALLLEPTRSQLIIDKMVVEVADIKEIEKGKFIVDFGQNIVGVPRINVPGQKGKKISLRFAEMLNKDGTLYTGNYRTARAQASYIPNADAEVAWQPILSYYGFRYIEISGLADGVSPSKDWISGIVLYNDMPLTGGFECSHEKWNILQSCIQWGQRGNFFSTPTDCPQRDERLGWTGDAQVFVPTAAFNMDVSAFFAKWMVDVRDGQTNDGRYPHIAPDILNEGGSPAWADAGIICPFEIYMAYGDVKILEDNYDAMKKWIEYMKNTSDGLVRPEHGYGDWLRPGGIAGKKEISRSTIGTAYFVRCADILSEIAGILEKPEDAKYFKKLAGDVRAAFIKRFKKEDGKIDEDGQTNYLLALGFDIFSEADRPALLDRLIESIEVENRHLNTGFVGTPLLNPVLARFGKSEMAYELALNETYPSWLYPINQGGTTMWERWNSYSHEHGFGDAGMNSFNHYAYGAIGEWLYRSVAGLWYAEPGYKKILFAPTPDSRITHAKAWHKTPYGLAESSWNVKDGKFLWDVRIPPNSIGKLVLPCGKTTLINGKLLSTYKPDMSGERPVVDNLKSGIYRIEIRGF